MPTKKVTKKTAAKKTAKKAPKKATTKRAASKKVATKKKSPTPKTTSKKTTSKKATSAGNQKALVYADDTKSFWVTDGQVLNSLLALRDALTQMEKDVYRYHAAGKKNDFADWVERVLVDKACAADLKKAKTPNAAKTIVVRHLKLYQL